jgi:Leucine-rich repeat (LRR) protein
MVTVSNGNSFNQAWAENKREQVLERTLDCPVSFSIGRLYVFKKLDLKNNVIAVNKATFHTHAQGRVKIPQKGSAFLVGNYTLGESLRPLQNFKGDDLQALKLNKLMFKENDLKYLTGMTGLKRIELDSTDVGDQGLKTLAKLPNLRYITLARSLVTGKTLADLAPLTKLSELLLGHNAIGNGNLNGVAAIQNLRALRLQACQIKDKDLEPIGRLKNLESLTLHENKKITDNGLKYLAKLPKLRYLDVGDTSITVAGLKALKNCPIDSLRLDVAQLSKEEIEELKKVFPKAEIKEESTGYHMDPTLFAPLH